jgi:hypothetical protein
VKCQAHITAERGLECCEQRMSIHLERVLAGPELLDDLGLASCREHDARKHGGIPHAGIEEGLRAVCDHLCVDAECLDGPQGHFLIRSIVFDQQRKHAVICPRCNGPCLHKATHRPLTWSDDAELCPRSTRK